MQQNQIKKKKTLGLVITDGVGYRNFCLSDFLNIASQRFSKIIIYSGLPAGVYDVNYYNNIEVLELPVFKEPFKTWFWRKFKEVAHLQLHKKFFGINDNLKANKSTSSSNRGKATRLIYKITHFFHSERFINILEMRQKKSLENNEVYKQISLLLKSKAPDLLFFTHQRPPYIMPLIFAAEQKSILTCSFIFSWDNLASKGRMAAQFESFLVWSDLMKEELLYFYPNTSEEKVEIVGTPQFEPYVLPRYKALRQEFLNKFNLPEDKKIICYSCGDISTSKNDNLYIEVIAEAIQQNKLVEDVSLLVRTSPAEEPTRFLELKEKFPFIKWNFPQWTLSRENHPEPWSQRIPNTEDLKDLRSILEYCHVGINMCSTMSLDFMLFDKPIVNPVFGNEDNGLYNDQRFLKYAHYKKVAESGAVYISKNKEELIEAINETLNNPQKQAVKRQKLIHLQTGKPLEGISKRIVETLLEFSREKASKSSN